jgi:signal transduction histidine kinase
VVHVKDSGPGISPRYHGRIFEKFFQVEDPLTRQYGGAGLGLCVAQGVAKAHGGCIEVMSDLGQGAEFRFYLPVCDAARDVAADREDEKSQAALASIRKEE